MLYCPMSLTCNKGSVNVIGQQLMLSKDFHRGRGRASKTFCYLLSLFCFGVANKRKVLSIYELNSASSSLVSKEKHT